MQPRIYTYKITFEEVPYYYYGSKKEKYFNEDYWGSPKTNKWCWELYTPKKQILEVFDYTDEGYEECRDVENRLIKPVLNDFWCLNESCNGKISLSALSLGGKKGNQIQKDKKIGIYSLKKEDRIENGKKGGKIGGNKHAKNKTGFCGRTKQKMSEDGKKAGKIGGKVSGKLQYELKKGIHGLSKEEIKKNANKGGKAVSSQKWKCLVTGFISTAGALGGYQKARGIDTSLRIRII